MSPPESGAALAEGRHLARGRLRLVAPPPLRVADVALFYGDRSGGIRTYLDAKAAHAARTGAFEHHLVVPGPGERHSSGRHELPSVGVIAANGYRLPLGGGSLRETIARIRPDVVVLHDPYWAPRSVTAAAQRAGARVVFVHHGSCALNAASLPGSSRAYVPVLRRWVRHAYREADAVMSAVDPWDDCRRSTTIPLRFGLDEAFRPRPDVARGDHVLYAGRLSREKGVLELLEAAARSRDPWPLRFAGSGPLESALRSRAAGLGIARRVSFVPFVRDRERLARLYSGARCVVMPGEHETFGMVALEAAACGARVVACDTAPAAGALSGLAHTFAAGDRRGLARAITRARVASPDPVAAAALAAAHRWQDVFAAELCALADLVR